MTKDPPLIGMRMTAATGPHEPSSAVQHAAAQPREDSRRPSGDAPRRDVFITGVTGYMGSRLAPRLIERGHRVRGLVRRGSESKVPPGVEPVVGDVLDARTWEAALREGGTLVHLVGVAHPSPAKAAQFRTVDLASARAAVGAASRARLGHFVYVSVAQPAPVMKAYVAARAEGESILRASGLEATILRPWYVLGPGHWWPYVSLPFYKLLEWIPATRESALRLGMVTLEEMVAAMVNTVDASPENVRIVNVEDIRRGNYGGYP